MLCICPGALLAGDSPAAPAPGDRPEAAHWRTDHHMHLASVDVCERVGDCLDANEPPAVRAADALRALQDAGVERGVVFSSAYLYGMDSLALAPDEVARRTRLENEFTRDEVARYPARLTGFLSVDPLQPGAVGEIRHWRGNAQLVGLKLHFTAAGVDLERAADRACVVRVIGAAASQGLPMAIHIGGGDFDAADAELFVRDILPAAGDAWVQIAHAGGGLPLRDHNHADVLGVFARHIAAGDPLTRHLLFDLSFVPSEGEGADDIEALVASMRQIGMLRFLFGSDYNVGTPTQAIAALARLELTSREMATLRKNCAPWACPVRARTH